jgi:hypothetical protein
MGGKGTKLAAEPRHFFESRFNHDFSNVKIHTGKEAADSAKAINAHAYTLKNNIVFAENKFQPETGAGKKLLAHELTHVIQQQGHSTIKGVQRFAPEDAVSEMLGKKFTLKADRWLGSIKLPAGMLVTVTIWSNTDVWPTVTGVHPTSGATHNFTVEKEFLVPVKSSSGLYQYSAGVAATEAKVDSQKTKIAAKEAEIVAWNAKKSSYVKNPAVWQASMDILQTDLKDYKYALTGEGYAAGTLPERLKKNVPIYPTLNKQLIQETMYNAMDDSIKKWTAHYNSTIGTAQGWTALDANIVKSMIFQESSMGTTGDFLPAGAPPTPRMTRFNVMQAIDSSGPQQIIMMDENDTSSPSLHARFNYRQVEIDRVADQATFAKLKKKKDAGTITAPELSTFTTLASRSDNGGHWNNYYTSDPRWSAAVNAFFAQTATARNLTYDFWIQTGIRWLFEKRKGVSDWAAAVKAYNGSGGAADAYKTNVIKRRDLGKDAAGGNFIPEKTY